VQVVRRHSRSSDAFRYAPAMSTVSGNYVAARRMGVVDGVDFGLTGMARRGSAPGCTPLREQTWQAARVARQRAWAAQCFVAPPALAAW